MTPDAPATLDRAGIAARVPHRGRMCLLDRLLGWDAQAIECSATGHADAAHPLRTASGLLAPAAIEYAAQAMALHGALLARATGVPATPGFLASARGVQLHRLRLDDLPVPAPGETRSGADPETGGNPRPASGGSNAADATDATNAGDPTADELRIEAVRQAGDAQQILYTFSVSHAGRAVADGRTAVVLNTLLAP